MNYPAWQLKKGDPAAETALAGAGCGVLLRRVLAARGCTDPAAAQELLGQGEPLSDPFLLKDMDKAVARIEQAIENEELTVIYGDYDVDGISATAILYECLTSQGAHVRCKLPTRGSGYGLTRSALESLASKGFKLVITVDNGISAVEEARCAKELGLDLIITDHHLPGDTLPEAIAVVDPKRADDESPFKDLCGAGVASSVCSAAANTCCSVCWRSVLISARRSAMPVAWSSSPQSSSFKATAALSIRPAAFKRGARL